MHLLRRRLAAVPILLASVLLAQAAHAQAPTPWEVDMQPGFSPIKRDIIALNWLVFVIITLITIFVGVLLAWALYRYHHRRNPVPTRVSHNTPLEIAWTVIPILILVIIAIPSFRLVYYEDRAQNPDLTVKVTGHQWNWEYTYPDQGGLDYASHVIPDQNLKPGQLRLLSVDNPLVLPVGKRVRILTTSADVIHSFFIPSLGEQRYAIPGETLESWVQVDKPGVYYGECNQICGTGHSLMPIEVHGVSDAEFQQWVKQTKEQQNAENGAAPAAPAPTAAPQLAEARR
ncbi:MAG: cytochrome c oxidase subunit II [Alphaproteobacteria bacterium]|nr:cytochrome c oxidase subunit II [Alphaproteobacteria bacterium]